MFALASMMPNFGGGGPGQSLQNDGFNYRIPPSWNPEVDSYSFRAHVTDLTLWVMLTDLQPHQQAAAIIMRLRGSARELGRAITPNEIMHGDLIHGVHHESAPYIIAGLHARFALLDEEARLSAMTEMLAFARRPHEIINGLLTPYEVIRPRAAH